MDWLFVAGIVLFLVVLMVTVAIHEAGHMIAAKLLKLDVPQYSIGFGPKLYTKKIKNTEYHIRWILLGGFVVIHDNRYPEKSYEREALSRVKPWKRQIVFVAGPAVNLVVGVAVLIGLLMSTPYQEPSNFVYKMNDCTAVSGCAALEAGLQVGDEIVEMDGIPIKSYEDIGPAKKDKKSLSSIVVIRDGKKVTIPNMKLSYEEETATWYLGIRAAKDSFRTLPEAWTFVAVTFENNFVALSKIPERTPSVISSIASGEKGKDDLASVVAAGKTYGDMAANQEITEENKIFNFIYWSALFNIGIGLINLLPFLPLDGGRMWIALCDSFRIQWAKLAKKKYNPVTQRMFSTMTAVSVIFIFGFMALIMMSDVSAIVAGNL